MEYVWIDNVVDKSNNNMSITFNDINPNSLPENLTSITFEWEFNRKAKLDDKIRKLLTQTREFIARLTTNIKCQG